MQCLFKYSYIIQPGDTIYNLAKRFHTSVHLILQLNPGIVATELWVGTRITICPGSELFINNTNPPVRPVPPIGTIPPIRPVPPIGTIPPATPVPPIGTIPPENQVPPIEILPPVTPMPFNQPMSTMEQYYQPYDNDYYIEYDGYDECDNCYYNME